MAKAPKRCWLLRSWYSGSDQARINLIYWTARGMNDRMIAAMKAPSLTASGIHARKSTTMARSLEEALAAVRAASTRTDSLIADRAALKEQVQNLLEQQGAISPELQAGLDEIFDIETADAAKIDAALTENTTG